MSKKRTGSMPTQEIKQQGDIISVGKVGGINAQINSAGKLGRHCDIVKSGCGVIDTIAKNRRKEKNSLKKHIKDEYLKS